MKIITYSIFILVGTLASTQWTDIYNVNTLVPTSSTDDIQSVGTMDRKTHVVYQDKTSVHEPIIQSFNLDKTKEFGDNRILANDVTQNFALDIDNEPEPEEGCFNTGEFDQWPSSNYTPSCTGVIENIVTDGWTGEFSKIIVTAGTEYIFSSSVSTDFITIAHENEDITFITGTGSVTWTPTESGAIRFFTHLDDDCTIEEVSRSRMVQCGDVPPPPTYTCEENFVNSNNFENGLFLGGADDQRLAVDVIVGNFGFDVQGLIVNIFVNGNTDLTFNVNFYNDAAGLPGTEFHTTGATIHSSTLVGNAFGYDIYEYLIYFYEYAELNPNSTYWMEIDTNGFAWEATTANILGAGLSFNNVNSDWTWTNNPTTDLVYELLCEHADAGVSDLSSFNFAYYPNPVKDMLNITSKKGVENVSVFNLAGQQILNGAKVNNGQVDMSALSAGTYVFRVTLEGGQIETFKVVKK